MSEPLLIGKYRVAETLGKGAFGVVYRCIDPDLDRNVAVKVLLAAEHASPELMERFTREARTAAKLSHPNIVPVFDGGIVDKKPFMVMEFVEGNTLDELLRETPWEPGPCLQLIYHLADALSHAHEKGIIHRDIKPSNVIIDRNGRPKLMDFGLARLADDARWLSATGDLIGTPRYMSPEQALLPSEEVDHRTDIYSLGAIFYELLTAKPIVDGPTPLSVLKKLTDDAPTPIDRIRTDLPSEVIQICEQMIAKSRDLRPASAREAADAIKSVIVQQAIGSPEIRSLANMSPMIHSQFSVGISRDALPNNEKHDALRFRSLSSQAEASTTRFRTLATVTIAALSCFVLFFVWITRSQIGVESQGSPDPQQITDESRDELRRRINLLASTRDDRQYHSLVNELREELNTAIRRSPSDVELRQLRAPLLARNGELHAALDDWSLVPTDQQDAITMRLKLQSLAMWESLFVRSITEGALKPQTNPELLRHLDRCLSMGDDEESKRAATIARWFQASMDIEAFDPNDAVSMPVLAKSDVAFADFQTWRAVCYFEKANQIHYAMNDASEDDRASIRQRRDALEQLASQMVREGLEADPHHMGLLFIRVYRWRLRFEWDTSDGAPWADAAKRHYASAESAFQRFRTASTRLAYEVAFSRAVLLESFGRNQRAIDQLSEFVDRSDVPAVLVAMWVWLQLSQPEDGEVDLALASSLLKSTEIAMDGTPPLFSIYFVRGLCYAAMGLPMEARREILRGKTVCGITDWGTIESDYRFWLEAADASFATFRDRTVDALWRLPVPSSVRFQLQENLVRDLTHSSTATSSEDTESVRNEMIAQGLFRLAKMSAERDDRAAVLRFARESLSRNAQNVTIETMQHDDQLSAWNTDAEFQEIYSEFATSLSTEKTEPTDAQKSETDASDERTSSGSIPE
jgi:serine/threonine protein kinase